MGENYLSENMELDSELFCDEEDVWDAHIVKFENILNDINTYIYFKINKNFDVFFNTVLKF